MSEDSQRPATVRFHPRMADAGPIQAVSPRLANVIEAAQAEDAFVLLLGERGNGRIHLATAAAHALTPQPASHVTVLPTPPEDSVGVTSVFGDSVQEPSSLQQLASSILDALEDSSHTKTLVAPDIDAYSPADLKLFRLILESPRAPRIIATATSLTAEVESVTRGIQHSRITVGPLNAFEANDYLSSLLGVQRIERSTLTRWLTLSRGKSYALAALAMASVASGSVQRSNGVAWVASNDDQVPTDFAELHTQGCSEAELQLLELVAVAEPITEATLLRSLDATLLARLFEQGFLSWRQSAHQHALVLTHVMVADSLRSRMSPPRRHEIYDAVFDLLNEDLRGMDPLHMPDRLIRLVTFGLHANRLLPQEWLWAAFELGSKRSDPSLALLLAQQVAAHPDVSPQRRGVALLSAMRLALLIGDENAAHLLRPAISRLLDDHGQVDRLEPALVASLSVARIRLQFHEHHNRQRVLDELEALTAQFAGAQEPATMMAFEIARAAHIYVLADFGHVHAAFERSNLPEVSGDLAIEWARSPARATMAMILAQRGETTPASALAKQMYSLSQLGSRARRDYVDMHGFCGVISNGLAGRSEKAAEICGALVNGPVQFAPSESLHAGFVDAAQLFSSIQSGLWSDASQQSEQLLQQLGRSDSFALTPLVAAARAFVLAVLGDRERAIECLPIAEDIRWGFGHALGGMRRLLVLRAHQWLRETNVVEQANALASWARHEHLALIELHALHVICYEQSGLSAAEQARAFELTRHIDSHQAPALWAHIEALVDPTLEDDSPEVRLLAELGVWLPLPPAPGLSAREREVALLAALGHTTKYIAARLFVSTRTVEAHLGRIFVKVGV